MLGYLLLVSRDGHPVADELSLAAARGAEPLLPFVPESSLRWSNRQGTVVVLAWQASTDNAGLGSHWHVSPDGVLTLFSGHCWPRHTGWDLASGQTWAHQLADWLQSNPVADAHEALFGFYTLLQLDPNGAGMVVTDLLGAGQLFTSEGETVVACSNRAGLAAAAAIDFQDTPERDPISAGWLAFWGSSLGDDSGYWDAARLPLDGQIVLGADGTFNIEHRDRTFWHRPGPHPTSGTYAELIDELDADLRQTLRVIAKLPEPDIELRLSGGKDSRLLTALLADEGLLERVTFLTHGLPAHADARAAQLVAERLGLRWTLEDRSTVSIDEEERRLLRHTFLVEGVTSAWDNAGIPVPLRGINLSGIGGECAIFGRTARAGLHATTLDEIHQLYRTKDGFDPQQLLTPEARRHAHATVRDWVDFEASRGNEPNRITSLFITRQRSRCWSGPSRAVKPTLWLGPFLIPSYIRFRQLLPIEDRANPRVHLDLLRRCAVDLSLIPLANDVWPEGAMAMFPDADRLRAVGPMRSLPGAPAGWRTARAPEIQRMLGSYLADPANPIFQVVDYQRAQQLVHHPSITGQGLRFLYGIATGAVWHAHAETPVRVNRDWAA